MAGALDRIRVGSAPDSWGVRFPDDPPDSAQKLGVDLFAIVEQDMYPCPPDKPRPIAVRTRTFLRSCGA